MKLLNKSALYNFAVSLLIMGAGAVGFYFIMTKLVNDEATEKLYIQRQRVRTELPLIDSVPANSRIMNNEIRFIRLADHDTIRESLRDTAIHESYDDEDVPHRILTCNAHSRLYNYEVVISQSLIESDDLIQSIMTVMLALLVVYLIAVVLINRIISKKIWKPFYEIIRQLEAFDIQRGDTVNMSQTNIKEFNFLNAALSQMTQKITLDYQNLKEFTENASHELQTPLAVIRAKIELILQSEQLSEAQWKQLSAINAAVTRLSRLSQSLLLLSKIENGQFNQAEPIDLSASLHQHLSNLDELITNKEIHLDTKIESHVIARLNPHLLDILLINLLTNAISHNTDKGFINVHLGKDTLLIQNSGPVLTADTKDLFTRFKKGNASGDSVGIGLSIVQKIAETSSLIVTYTYDAHIHTVLVRF